MLLPAYQHHHTVGRSSASGFERPASTTLKSAPAGEETGPFYRWTHERNLLIGSGVNVVGTRRGSR